MTQTLPPSADTTQNLAVHRLRRHEDRQRINPAYLHSAETLILNVATGQPYILAPAVQLGHRPPGSDAWIGELPVIQFPPAPQPVAEELIPGMDLPHFPIQSDVLLVDRPAFKPSKHRREAPAWALVAIGFGAGFMAAAAALLSAVTW